MSDPDYVDGPMDTAVGVLVIVAVITALLLAVVRGSDDSRAYDQRATTEQTP